MADSSDLLQLQLQALRDQYAVRLDERLSQVETAWLATLRAPEDAELLATLQRQVHGLVGSGAMFGFDELSAVAKLLDQSLQVLLASDAPPTAAQRADVEGYLKALREAARPAAPPPGSPPEEPLPAPARIVDNRLIYLVEDDDEQAREVALQLGYFGYSVRAFARLAELDTAVRAEAPAAIIMDVDLDANSARILTTLHQAWAARIPLVFISSHNELVARLLAVRTGGAAYFPRPIDVGALIDQLDVLTAQQAPEPYRILIVDDSRTISSYCAAILQQAGMIAAVVTNPMEVMRPLEEFRPDLILMDMYMPGCTGLELAAVIRQQEAYVGIPIVFLSAETDVEKQLAAIHLGGDDFLTKPIRPAHLISAVSSRVQRARTLRALMVRDSLTGLLNHTAIKERLELEVARARRMGAPLAFALIDIDHFKSVNDTYGHPTGDRVLKGLARLLQQRLRRSDGIGRYGGEEFAIILPDTDGPTAAAVLDEVRSGFEHIHHQSGERAFAATFSCGIAAYPAVDEAARLNDTADKALYEAKRGGRNRVVLAEQQIAHTISA